MLFIENLSDSGISHRITSQHSDDVSIYISCLLSSDFVKLGKMTYRKSEEILVAVRKTLRKPYQIEKNKTERERLLGITRSMI